MTAPPAKPLPACLTVGRCIRPVHNVVGCGVSEWGCKILKLQQWGYTYHTIWERTGLTRATLSVMRNDPTFDPKYSTGIRLRRFFVRVAIERKRQKV